MKLSQQRHQKHINSVLRPSATNRSSKKLSNEVSFRNLHTCGIFAFHPELRSDQPHGKGHQQWYRFGLPSASQAW